MITPATTETIALHSRAKEPALVPSAQSPLSGWEAKYRSETHWVLNHILNKARTLFCMRIPVEQIREPTHPSKELCVT